MNSQETHSRQAYQVIRQVRKAVIGKDDCIRKVMMAILSSGHILLKIFPELERPLWLWPFPER